LLEHTVGDTNPFAVLTAIVAPAILTNASSVLVLSTGNRLGRVVDRTRIVARELAALCAGATDRDKWSEQLKTLHERSQMLVKGMRCFYAAIGLFAASAFISLVGSIAAYYGAGVLFKLIAVLATATGTAAVVALVAGAVLMTRETRLAVQTLSEEAEIHSHIPSG
jgi:hypothetical protein